MASSSDRDKDSNESQPKPDNPFIRFRQFADAQIGSLLQGIIGLPSAFTRNSPANGRWAEFDEDLRRRDELRARQKELKDSEARKQQQQPAEQDAEVPLKKWPSWGTSNSDTATNSGQVDEKASTDIPLYSPVSKSIFTDSGIANDREDRDDGDDWKPLKPLPDFIMGLFHDGLPGSLGRDKMPSDPMKRLQLMVYNDLNNSPVLRSQYSLLPYLLFSPYSPIKLSSSIQSPTLAEQCQKPDEFPYYEAFEDLLLITQGRPMGLPWSRFGFQYRDQASSSMHWIYKLWMNEILQQSETRDIPAPSITELISFPKAANEKPTPEQEKVDAQTEQEMYDRFLRRASSPTGVAEALDSLFTDAEGWIEKRLAERDSPEVKRAMRDFLESKPGKELEEIKRRSVSESEPDKVVFTSTTSEHTTNEDGSVETSVTVWKRFADGRETVTTTSHTEDPARDDEGNVSERRENEEVSEEEKEEKKKERKGWFWN